MKKILIALLLFSSLAMAEAEENHCLDPELALGNKALAKQDPNDLITIRLVALRTGLCEMVDKGIVDIEFAIEFAIDLFETERQQGANKRITEEQTSNLAKGA